MRAILLFISVTVLLYSFAARAEDYYSVSDQDGYVNLRGAPSIEGSVWAHVINDDCVIGLYQINGWTRVLAFELKSKTLQTGYIHGSRLKKQESCREAPNIQQIPMGDIVMESLNADRGFLDAVKWYESNKSRIVDDGYYAEGYSDYVMKTLAKSFHSNVKALTSLKGTHAQFVQFVLRHIDPTGSVDDLEAIASHAPECSDESDICKDIAERAKASLHAGIAGAGEVSVLDINQVKAMLQKEGARSTFDYLMKGMTSENRDGPESLRTGAFFRHIMHGDKEWFTILTQFYKAGGLVDGIYSESLSAAVADALSRNPEVVFSHWKAIGQEPDCGSNIGEIEDLRPADVIATEELKALLSQRSAVSNIKGNEFKAAKSECLAQINSRIKFELDYAKGQGLQVEIDGTNVTVRSK